MDESFSFTPATGDVVHVMGTCYGGYLDTIYNMAKQSRAVINYIDGTGSGRTSRQYIYKDEEDESGSIPGI